jgi:flagella basal body P-ring formation protein FlgA
MMRMVAVVVVAVLAVVSLAAAAPAGQVLSEATVKEIVADYVRQRTASLGIETGIRKIGPIADLKLPAGELSYEVQAPRSWEGWGRASLALIVRVNGQVVKNLPVNVEVEALGDTVVALRPLERGDVIGSGDVAVQKRDISTISGRSYRGIDEVLGKRVKVPVRANTPLKGEHLEKIPLVKSGQLVTIIAENNALRLTSTGRARSSGAEGDVVLVQSLASPKEIPARVVDAGTVRVDF